IFRITAGMDSGPMLAWEALNIGPDETAGQLEARLAPLGASLALRVLDQLEAGTAVETTQDESQVSMAPKLKKGAGLIHGTRPAAQVCCQVRAMPPWPPAHTHSHRAGHPPLRLILHRAAALGVSPDGVAPTPGEVLLGHPRRLLVGAGEGV